MRAHHRCLGLALDRTIQLLEPADVFRAAHAAELQVTGVRVDHASGVAVLGFKTLPGRQLRVAREGKVWKVDGLLDLELP